jgi:hypothetical protein
VTAGEFGPPSPTAGPDLADGAWRGAASRLELWTRLGGRLRPRTVLEIGVWKGAFAEHVLRAAPSIERYVMIDPWRPLAGWNKPLNVSAAEFEAAYETALERTDFAADRRHILRGTATEVIDQVDDASCELIYVDGDHTLRGAVIDLVTAWPKLAVGGWLAGDDFSPSIRQHGAQFEPTLVFPTAIHFAEAVGAPIWALPFQQFVIEKPPPGVRSFAFVDLTGAYPETGLLRQFLAWLVRRRRDESS